VNRKTAGALHGFDHRDSHMKVYPLAAAKVVH
jgi:hypothetical protein